MEKDGRGYVPCVLLASNSCSPKYRPRLRSFCREDRAVADTAPLLLRVDRAPPAGLAVLIRDTKARTYYIDVYNPDVRNRTQLARGGARVCMHVWGEGGDSSASMCADAGVRHAVCFSFNCGPQLDASPIHQEVYERFTFVKDGSNKFVSYIGKDNYYALNFADDGDAKEFQSRVKKVVARLKSKSRRAPAHPLLPRAQHRSAHLSRIVECFV